MEDLKQAAVSKIVIERPHKKCRVTIHSARPGIVIGKKGADIEKLRKKVAAMTDSEVHINIVEVRKPEIDATLVAAVDRPAARAPRRLPPRHEARRAVGDAPRRRGHPHHLRRPSRRRRDRAHGVVPRGPRAAAHAARRHRLRPRPTANTAYGTCGVKVWIFKGEIMEHDPMASERAPDRGRPSSGGGRRRRAAGGRT